MTSDTPDTPRGPGHAWEALRWAVSELARSIEDASPAPAATAKAPRAAPEDASNQHERYRQWLASRPPPPALPAGAPSISVLVPVYKPDLWYLEACVESVLAQSSRDLELCLCDDRSGDPDVARYLRRAARRDPRVKLARHESNRGISAATNTALGMARGDFVALLDHDDVLAPHALQTVSAALAAAPQADVLYTDEDKLDGKGLPFGPRFKPDWSPEYLLSTPYMGHLLVLRRSLVESLGGWRSELDGAQDFDMMLRATEQARAILHLPEVLYHWRIVPGSAAGDPTAKPWAYEATGRALASALERRGEEATKALPGAMPGMWSLRRPVPAGTTVAAVVDAHGPAGPLRDLVETLLGRASVVLAPRPGLGLETEAVLRALQRRCDVAVVPAAPSWGERADAGWRACDAELVAFLDGQLSPASQDWLEIMAGHALHPGIGAVGARLVTPDGRIAHVGLVLGMPGPFLAGVPCGYHGYLESGVVCRNWSAVSGRCLLTRRSLLKEGDGLDAAMGEDADLDWCLRMGRHGLRSVVDPAAELVIGLPWAEPPAAGGRAAFVARWGGILDAGDPYFSPHLSLGEPAGRLRAVP